MDHRSISVIVLACAAGFVPSSLGDDAAAGGLVVGVSGGMHTLAVEGRPAFHMSERAIANGRLIAVAGTAYSVAIWDEGPAATRRYAVLADGRRVSRVREQRRLIKLQGAHFDPLLGDVGRDGAGEPALPAHLMAGGDSELYIVQFKTRPIEAYREAVRGLGGVVHQFLADQAHVVRMDRATRDAVEALPFVRWVGEMHPAYKVEPFVRHELAEELFAPARRYNIKVLEADNAMKQRVAAEIEALGGTIDRLTADGFLLEATLDQGQLLRVLSMNDVQFVDRWFEPEDDMDLARIISGANVIETVYGYTGQGVRGEAMDGGLLTSHVEFANKNILIHGGNSSSTGHGTPVTGIIFGEGINNAQSRGVMPDAETIIFNARSTVSNRHQHTAELVDPSGPYRAVFQTNSWGSGRTTFYTNVSAEMDDIIFNTNLVITQSQSNAGNRDSRPQAWSKNIVSVGGVRHYNTLTKSDDAWAGGASIGPADDGRIKPDLTHFYDSIWTTGGDSNTHYRNFSGTSGATPITAGYFGLFHQMWAGGVFGNDVSGGDVFDERPNATTAKAMMINTAAQYSFSSPADDLSRAKQGWGMVDLGIAHNDRDRFFVIDESEVLGEFESHTRSVLIGPNDSDFRVTMVYVDPAGNPQATVARINDLSLRVVSPSGVEYWGNNGLFEGNWSQPGGDSNTVDTVENVFVQSPEAGLWTVEVIADEINQDARPGDPGLNAGFALVVAGGEVVPTAFTIALPTGAPEFVAPGEPMMFPVEITPGAETVAPGEAVFHYRYDDGPFVSVPMAYLGDDVFEAVLPPANCGDEPEFFIGARGSGGTELTLPANAPASVYEADVGVVDVVFDDDFETDKGWTVFDTPALTDGTWERGVPIPWSVCDRGNPPSDFDGSGQCYLTANRATPSCNSDVDEGATILTSPRIDASGGEAVLSYARWFSNTRGNNPGVDPFDIEVSNDDGETWTLLERVGPNDGQNDGGWFYVSFIINDVFPEPSDQFRVRFIASDLGPQAIVEAAVDAVSLRVFACEPTCRPDLNSDGVVDADDFFLFLSLFADGDPIADFNNDGVIDADDFFEFLAAFAAGC